MNCPVCQRPLEHPRWTDCACSLTWASEVDVLQLEGREPWPHDDRRVRVSVSPFDVVIWFVTLPFGALGAAAALLSVHNVLHGTDWVGWGGALIGIPLGTRVAWGWVRPVARLMAQVFAPERVEVKAGAAIVFVRGDRWRRTRVSFADQAITSVCLSGAQGDFAHVWLTHREGPSLLLATLPTDEARSMLLRLTA